MPALYNLAGSGLLNPDFKVLGVARSEGDDTAFRTKQLAFMKTFGHKPDDVVSDTLNHAAWNWLEQRLHYMSGGYDDPETYLRIAEQVGDGNAVFFLAVPSENFTPIATALNASGLMKSTPKATRRIVIEKPFGHDLVSAKKLNSSLLGMFEEDQIYRIDHFLGKETVQNILALRFANSVWQPLWNNQHIESVQVTAAETVGVEQRASFYESTGALRDMIPNHLFQLMALVGMDVPNSLHANDIRTAKAEFLKSLRPLQPESLKENVVLGQYTAGVVNNRNVPAYLNESNVNPASRTETYVALKLMSDNPNWQGVPFYLRTGKHLNVRKTEIVITFKPAPFNEGQRANSLHLRLQPDEGIALYINVKKPGQGLSLCEIPLDMSFAHSFNTKPSTGYESLLYDVLTGNPALYNRADSIEIGWEKIQPILDAINAGKTELHLYKAGSEGPSAANHILENDHQWRNLG